MKGRAGECFSEEGESRTQAENGTLQAGMRLFPIKVSTD